MGQTFCGAATANGWPAVSIVAALLSVCAAAVAAEFESPIAITGVTVFTGHGGESIPNAVILIEHGRIVDVGRALPVPADADVIDATGMVAYPGFVSAHSYLGIDEEERSEEQRIRMEDENPDPKQRALPRTRSANRRGIHPQFRAQDHYNVDEKARDTFRTQGYTTLLIAPRSGIFGGTSALVDLVDAPLRRSILRTDVAQHVSFAVGEPGRYPRSLLGVFAQFRQVLLDTAWSVQERQYFHRHPKKVARPPIDPSLDSLESVVAGDMPIIFVANSEHEINRALNLAAEFHLRIIISGAKEAYKVIDRIKADHVPLIVSLNFDEEPEYGKKKSAASKSKVGHDKPGESTGADESEKPNDTARESASKDNDEKRIYEPLKIRKERRRLWEEHVANVIRLDEAGIAFSLSTNEFEKPAEMMKNLRLVIDRGLPVATAIAALTRNPAEMLGVAEQLGRLESGSLANVVVMSKPLEDDKSKVRFVIVDGKKSEFNREDEKKTKKDDAGKDDKTQADDGTSTKATAAAESSSETSQPEIEEEGAPTWRAEIDADRVPKTRTGGNVLIQNATVITVSGPTLEHASVLIENGKITAVGADVAAPDGVTVIDATGRYVIPGMIDPHSHMAVSGVNEGAMSITAEVRMADMVYNDSVAIYRALAGGVTTNHVMHGSANPIGGQNVVFKLKYERPVEEMIMADAPRTIKFALGENVKQSNFFRAFGERYPNSRMGVEAVIRDAFTMGRQYAAEWDAYRRDSAAGLDVLAPRRDLRLEAIADILRGDLWIHSHCYRSDEILRLMAVAEDFGVRIAVLQHVLEGYRVAPEIARHGAGASTFSNFWAYKVEAYQAIPYNAALLTRAGVNTTLNSDSPNTIRRMNVEAAKCIKWGDLTENQALRLVTLNPAIQLGIEHRVGSIDVGKDGDLAIFNGHPLNAYSRNEMTLIEGEVFFETEHKAPVSPAGALEWNRPADTTLPASAHRLFAIVGGTVHPVSGAAMENATVLIRNDRIVAVGSDVDVPPGAGVVDATGLHVYPGLIDGGGSLGLKEIDAVRSTRDNFEISTFGPELRARSAVHSHSAHIAIARSGGITSQLVKPTGGIISGQSALIDLDGWTADQMLVLDRVGLHMSVPILPYTLYTFSAEQKKTRKESYDKSMRDLEAFLGRAKRYAAARKMDETDLEQRVVIDPRLEAMLPYVRGEKPVIFRASSYQAIVDTIAFAEKHGLKPIIAGGTDAWKLANELKEKNIPVIVGTVLSYPRGEFEAWDAIYAGPSVLDKAGVRWCFASESASSAYDLAIGAGMAVAHGLPEDRAVRALTLGAAELFGVDDRLGSLEPGKIANVIVTTHAPTQTVFQVTHMFINGRPVTLESMHTRNFRRFKNRPAPELPPQKTLIGPPSLTGL